MSGRFEQTNPLTLNNDRGIQMREAKRLAPLVAHLDELFQTDSTIKGFVQADIIRAVYLASSESDRACFNDIVHGR